jgi:F-type H+-transporting ATPase subunit alpha
MPGLREDLAAWLATRERQLAGLMLAPRLERVGRVARTGDGIAEIEGLAETGLNEVLRFASGALGIAVRLEAERVGCVLVLGVADVAAGEEVRGTGDVARVPVGPALLGRILDATGRPLDDGPRSGPSAGTRSSGLHPPSSTATSSPSRSRPASP